MVPTQSATEQAPPAVSKSAGVVVLLSGGLDSSTLLHSLAAGGELVYPLTLHYGQRHRKEIEFAKQQAAAAWRRYGNVATTHPVISLQEVFAGIPSRDSLTNPEVAVPHGHYAEESMKQTVVPNRNMLLISVAAAYAITVGAQAIGYAAHAGDHTIYPDCRPEFLQAMNGALALTDFQPLELVAPFLSIRKEDIVSMGHELGVDYGATWSCYEGGVLHCGRCGTCVERREAFQLAKVPDPTLYENEA